MPSITYLVGPPACGKLTIAQELSALTGAALIDNHLINDPIFRAYGADGRSALPEWIWDLAAQVREATMAAVSGATANTSHIFTNYLGSDPSEGQFLQRLRAIAKERGARFVPVWLTCTDEELIRRVGTPERAQRQKLRDPDSLRHLLQTMGVFPAPPDALVLDTSTIPADAAAKQIVAWDGGFP